jgi:hypothetical protein
MSVLLAFTANDNDYVIVLDASISEQHAVASDITEHNVETGSAVNDHIRPRQPTVRIQGLITNTPITKQLPAQQGYSANQLTGNFSGTVQPVQGQNPVTGQSFSATQSLQFPNGFNRVKDVAEALYAAQAAGVLVFVSTSLATYENMGIESIDIPREAALGQVLKFGIALKHINYVDTQTVATQTAPQASKKRKGSKPLKPDDSNKTAQKKQSLGHALASRLLGG